MAASSVPAVKAALLTSLKAALTAKVTWGGPTERDDVRRDHVWFGNVDQTEEWLTLGATPAAQGRQEDYTLEVVAQSWRRGDDPQAVEEAVYAIRESISGVLRADPGVTSLLNQYAEVASTRVETVPVEDGWVSKATLSVHCRAAI